MPRVKTWPPPHRATRGATRTRGGTRPRRGAKNKAQLRRRADVSSRVKPGVKLKPRLKQATTLVLLGGAVGAAGATFSPSGRMEVDHALESCVRAEFTAHGCDVGGDVVAWNMSRVANMEALFYNDSTNDNNLYAQFNEPIGNWDTSRVTNMAEMFRDVPGFNQPIADWDVANVQSMIQMFHFATRFNQPIGGWDMARVTNMWGMFAGAKDFYHPIGDWDVSNVIQMQQLFMNGPTFTSSVTTLENWDVSKVNNMIEMFRKDLDECSRAALPGSSFQRLNIAKWDVSSVHDISFMFAYPETNPADSDSYYLVHGSDFNEPIHGWDVSKVQGTAMLFTSAVSFNQPLGDWDVSRVTAMFGMFQRATSFNSPIGNWDVSRVSHMWKMFSAIETGLDRNAKLDGMPGRVKSLKWTSRFNQPIGQWDVSRVTDTRSMFESASRFNQPLENWDVSRVTNMQTMFASATAFNQPLANWDVSTVRRTSDMFNSPPGNVRKGKIWVPGRWAAFNQPLENWDVSSLDSMAYMFKHTQNFRQIFCGIHWHQNALIDPSELFRHSGGALACCPAGRYVEPSTPGTAAAAATSTGFTCTHCSPGRYQDETAYAVARHCKDCHKGSAIMNESFAGKTCQACGRGQYQDKPGTEWGCKSCPAGRFAGKNSSVCSSCPAGRFQTSTDMGACTPCSAGRHQNQTGTSFCDVCLPGEYQDSPGQPLCKACAEGRHQVKGNAKSEADCLVCTAGKFSDTRRTSCLPCPAGKWGAGGKGQSKEITACRDCDPGFYSSAEGVATAEGCTACSSGQYANRSGANRSGLCGSCGPGQFRANHMNETFCADCPLGYYQDSAGQASCLRCTPSEYQNKKGQRQCKKCERGTASGETNRTKACDACAPGFVAKDRGNAMCLPCLPGSFRSSGDAIKCIDCPSGYFQREPNASSCIKKSADSIVLHGGAAEVKVPLGSYIKCNDATAGAAAALPLSPSPSPSSALADRGSAGGGNRDENANCTFAPCLAGTFGSDPPTNEPCQQCPAGSSSFDNSIACAPCAKGRFNPDSGSLCEECPSGYFQPQNEKSSLRCVRCPEGYEQTKTGEGACVDLNWLQPGDCTIEEYLNDTDSNRNAWGCEPCPKGGRCGDRAVTWDTLGPKPGWWKIPAQQRKSDAVWHDVFAECFHPQACSGAAPEQNTSADAPGGCSTKLGFKNASRLCQACSDGWYRSLRHGCLECRGEMGDSAVLLFVGSVVLFFCGFGGLISYKLRAYTNSKTKCCGIYGNTSGNGDRSSGSSNGTSSFDGQQRRKASHQTLKRVFLAHVQVTSFVMALSVPWPDSMVNVLSIVSAAVSVTENTNKAECLMMVIDARGHGVGPSFVYGVLVAVAILPVLFAVLLALFWMILVPCMMRRSSRREGVATMQLCGGQLTRGPLCLTSVHGSTTAPANDDGGAFVPTNADLFVSSCVLMWYLILPSIVRVGSSAFQCRYAGVPDPGKDEYLAASMEETCWRGRHLAYVLGVSLPMLILYGLIVPATLILRLWQVGDARVSNPSLMLRFSLVHSGFRKEKYWWELVVLVRKYAIIAVPTFIQSDTFQLLWVLAVLILALHAHDSHRPFEGKDIQAKGMLHHYETQSLQLLVFMVWCGLFFVTLSETDACENEYQVWCQFMGAAVLVLQAGFMLLLLGQCSSTWCKSKCKSCPTTWQSSEERDEAADDGEGKARPSVALDFLNPVMPGGETREKVLELRDVSWHVRSCTPPPRGPAGHAVNLTNPIAKLGRKERRAQIKSKQKNPQSSYSIARESSSGRHSQSPFGHNRSVSEMSSYSAAHELSRDTGSPTPP